MVYTHVLTYASLYRRNAFCPRPKIKPPMGPAGGNRREIHAPTTYTRALRAADKEKEVSGRSAFVQVNKL